MPCWLCQSCGSFSFFRFLEEQTAFNLLCLYLEGTSLWLLTRKRLVLRARRSWGKKNFWSLWQVFVNVAGMLAAPIRLVPTRSWKSLCYNLSFRCSFVLHSDTEVSSAKGYVLFGTHAVHTEHTLLADISSW